MAVFAKLGELACGFRRDRRGNFAVITAAIASVLAMAAGFALNTGQLFNVRSSLSAALDAAVTSTARDITTGRIRAEDAEDVVRAFLLANTDTGFAPVDRVVLSSLVVDPAARTVAAQAYVDTDLVFPLFGLSKHRRVAAESVALYSDKIIEVAMMLDITGSMAKTWRTDKIGDLKTAATNAVNALLGDDGIANPRVRVAIVPYAEAVNTGPLAHTVYVEKEGGSDLPPSITAPRAVATAPDACATERKTASGRRTTMDLSDSGPAYAMVNRDDRLSDCPTAALQPLTSNADALRNAISKFNASGVTAGHIGIQWTRYLLSPRWRDTLEAAVRGSGPAEYNAPRVSKVAILMTDGEFNTAFAGVADGAATRMAQGTRSRGYAEDLCRRMRQDGIEVFTIGFMLEEADAKSTMRACASPDTADKKHYFEASTGAELDKAFKEIVRNIEKLSLIR